MNWNFERGEGRHKHRWKQDEAGFQPGRNGSIGKCHRSITEELATEILNKGVPVYNDPEDSYPGKIYTLYRGVIYEAVPTTPGVSWHGYPWRGDLPGRPGLPRSVKNKLESMAQHTGYSEEYEKWLKQYG
ncbi:hypothetical protein [Nitrincola sp. MINF-07-Sa-05]|uniref:hypothetical protein n=1 Tax=Nitrincola salilacus TaxID=3400273 RepID=UPI0039180669